MLLVGRQEGHPACKKTEWWGAGMVISLEQGADLHMAQLMPLPLTVSCFSKIQIGFTFLVPAHPGSPGQMAVKRVCVLLTVAIISYSVQLLAVSAWHTGGRVARRGHRVVAERLAASSSGSSWHCLRNSSSKSSNTLSTTAGRLVSALLLICTET